VQLPSVAVKTGPSEARATAEGAREAVLTAASTTSASAWSGGGASGREQPRQHHSVVRAPSTAAAAVRHARAADALGRRPAEPRGGRSLVLRPDFQRLSR
jgi:hypothetical protein